VEAALAVVVVVRGAECGVSRRSGQQTSRTGFSVLVSPTSEVGDGELRYGGGS